MRILLGLSLSDLLLNVAPFAIKCVDVRDSTLNENHQPSVRYAMYHTMHQGQTWWTTQPGIIMLLRYDDKNVNTMR